MDAFIANKRSKAGKRFGFVRFLGVKNEEQLARSLASIWICSYHISASAARFNRQEKNEAFSKNNGDKTTNSIPSQKADQVGSSQNKKSYASFMNGDRDSKVKKQVTAVKGNTLSNVPLTPSLITPALVLDDSCVNVRDLSRHVMSRVKDLNSNPNLRTLLTKEGFSNVKLTYLGGMWVMIELDNEATKLKLLQHIGVNSWFHVFQTAIHDFVSDERIVWVDIEGKRLCIKTKHADNILVKFKVIFKGKVYMAHAKELFTWTPIFLDHKESEYISDDESLHGAKNKSVGSQHREDDLVDDSDVEGVSETFFGVCNSCEKMVEQQSEDRFCIYDVLNKKPKGVAQDSDSSLSHPPGFTPEVSRQENDHRGVDLNTGTDKVNSPLVHTKVMNNSQKSNSRHFNHFITSSGLVDVKLEGYSFTWAHPSATKMSKLDRFLVSKGIISLFPSITALCLDRHLSDHRPILLREIHTDYGPIPFRFYHSWFKWDGFDVMDKKLQQSDAINSIKEDLIDIDKNLDSKDVSDEILLKRMELTRQLHDINQMEARDYVQKSKIKWAIEGDKNLKFFHGIINKKRSQLSIRRVFVDGDWNTDPEVVKDVFKDHFATRFKQPAHGRLKLNILFPNRLSTYQVADMDRSVSRDEIRVAVWNYGENKSPGPDGGSFPKGSNSSFIALIPKVTDAKFVTDFRPISLIGCVYKVVTKILSNHLATVISDLVSDIQSAFVANRQILDGPFILNEMLALATSDGLFKGLKINIQKSQVLGVGIPRNIVNQAASLIGCAVMQNPFRYLGVMVGDIPKGVLKEMEAIRCNFFNGVDPAERKITWISWDKVLASNKNGSLGVLSFYALNRALLLKWVWRFLSQDGSPWYRVIQALYGASFELHPVNQSSIWCSILREMQVLISKCFDFVSHSKKRVGEGYNTRFWYDSWVFDQPLRVKFPCLFALETDKESTVASELGSSLVDASFRRSVRDEVERQQWDDLNSVSGSVTLFASKDRWFCDLNGDGVFRVKEVRTILDEIFLPSTADATRWVKDILIKINVLLGVLSLIVFRLEDLSLVGSGLARSIVLLGLECLVFCYPASV
nr:RNA-directed DNA polymerase, eukaryota [Tanacetum cinerariifolium]